MGKKSSQRNAEQKRLYRQQKEELERAKQKRQNTIIWSILIAVLVIAVVAAVIGIVVSKQQDKKVTVDPTNQNYVTADGPTEFVRMTVQYTDAKNHRRQGEIIFKLRADVAPITVANFQKLVSQKFYDGLTFHRVVEGFMIQGGDPKGDGTGGSPDTIKGEFSSNGVENKLSHKRGVVSMARSSDKNSASSQFFIVHKDSQFLDGDYAAFAEVISGMDAVDGIASTHTVTGMGGEKSSPVKPVNIVTVEFVKQK